MNDLTWAVLSGVFLLGVFFASLFFLQKVRERPAARYQSGDPRQLNDDELAKLRRRLEREAARLERERQAELAKQALEMAKPSAYQEKLRRREEERLAKEHAESEQQARRELEISKWKAGISVVNEGVADPLSDEASLGEFLDYIRARKTVELEALSSAFRITVEDIVDRIKSLEKDQLIYGIMDDRGRYMALTPGDVENVKKFVTESETRIPLRKLHFDINSIVSRH